jgi:hypothetical protein
LFIKEKWILVNWWETRMDCGYGLQYFDSEEAAYEEAKELKDDERVCIAKVIHEFDTDDET